MKRTATYPDDADLRELIGSRITAARSALGIKQEVLAGSLGVSPGTQSKYEKGVHRPTWKYLWLLEKEYRVPLSYLWTGSTAGMPQVLRERIKSDQNS